MFGEGAAGARVVMVGEQPGHEEDLAGRPFVGPAGRLLHDVMQAIGLGVDEVYVTNAVKHFKWVAQEGTKRRLHKKPSSREIEACSPWLAAELAVIRPDAVVALGATAAQALLGKSFRVSKQRGELLTSPLARVVMATVHPSAVLRAPDSATRHEMRAALSADLAKLVAAIGQARLPEGGREEGEEARPD